MKNNTNFDRGQLERLFNSIQLARRASAVRRQKFVATLNAARGARVRLGVELVHNILAEAVRKNTGRELEASLLKAITDSAYGKRGAPPRQDALGEAYFQTRGARRGDKARGPVTHTRLKRAWRFR